MNLMPQDNKKTSLFDGASILVTGGTGSFGEAFVQHLLKNARPQKLVIFSRDELKQYEMQQRLPPARYPALRYYLGDVRDVERLKQAMAGVDYVVHAAAMKQIPASEYNPFECIKTNVNGAENVILAAIHCRVKRVIALSTDKAVNPVNLYGATKLASDKMFVSGNNMSGDARTKFGVVRYGNVLGSRGSVVPYFLQMIRSGVRELPLTDLRMTRFWITLEQGIRLVQSAMEIMEGGEIFVPKIPSMRMVDVAQALAPGCRTRVVGTRPGEKMHECMIPRDEAVNAVEFGDCFVIQPAFYWWDREAFRHLKKGRAVNRDFEYSSDKNTHWLTGDEFRRLVEARFGPLPSPKKKKTVKHEGVRTPSA